MDPVTYDFRPHLKARDYSSLHDFGSDFGRCGHSLGISQIRGHGSWLVCEVTLVPVVVLGDWSRRRVFGCWMFWWVIDRSVERRFRE